MVTSKRDRHDIIRDILEIAKNGAKKTTIIYKANLNFTLLQKYLEALNEAGFIIQTNGNWTTTEKGLQVLEACDICRRLLDSSLYECK